MRQWFDPRPWHTLNRLKVLYVWNFVSMKRLMKGQNGGRWVNGWAGQMHPAGRSLPTPDLALVFGFFGLSKYSWCPLFPACMAPKHWNPLKSNQIKSNLPNQGHFLLLPLLFLFLYRFCGGVSAHTSFLLLFFFPSSPFTFFPSFFTSDVSFFTSSPWKI